MKILVALTAGVAAGTVLGIFLAPDKGSETRRKIREGGQKLTDGIKEGFSKCKEQFDNLKEDIAQTVKEKKEEFAEFSRK